MKFGIGMYIWTTDVAPEHYPIFTTLAELGYDGAEIPVGSGLAADNQKIRHALDDAGLGCTTILNLAAEQNPVSPDAAVRRRGLDEIRFGIDAAHTLGSTVLSGPFQTAYAVFSGAGPTEQELTWSAEVMRSAAEHAAEAGVVLAVEFLNRHEGYLLNTMAQSASLTARVDHPSFGVLYDTHHAHAEEDDVVAAITTHGAAIKHVQASENNRGVLGAGQVHWAATARALQEIGYDGWVAAEAFAADVPGLSTKAHVWRDTFGSKDRFAANAIGFMRDTFASEAAR
ncbi:sugar phosphate isomerase/epimerase [Nocardioides sp. cx-173]|uniref:sugar phosphate isomerase/epimerase family protein n=1 Tax=Nocardioides sp. cx-173 TaxID=2898796 RepID=UPI001E57A561|nr:sugar phosphate isomerase/epimerase family protein [Nocardioides sp. cx-173]MCD4526635.1 sugar phosphate isomerase/epimerase [Nocardioides sp. cx-173]UGB40728.1 sugar phosphate isomerase/epimerase [Nocardioides sp. cx-173]